MLCFDLICLRLLGVGSKDVNQVLILPLLNIIIAGVHAMDVSLDGVTLIANDESEMVRFLQLASAARAYMIGLRSFLIIVLTSWAVNSNEPSPTNRMVLLSPVSFAANAAPWHAPTE